METAAKKVAYVPSIAMDAWPTAVKGHELAQTKTNHVAFAVEKQALQDMWLGRVTACEGEGVCRWCHRKEAWQCGERSRIAPASVSGANGAPALDGVCIQRSTSQSCGNCGTAQPAEDAT